MSLKGCEIIWRMILKLNTFRVRTLQDLRDFTAGNDSFDLEPVSRCNAYRFIEATYRQFDYPRLGKVDKGALKAYLGKATGLSRAQLTRLLAQCRETGTVRDRRGTPAQPYRRHYTAEDVTLLAETDRLHENLSGPAIRQICRRQYQEFGDERYQRLAFISNGHLYNLRQTPAYRRQNQRFQSTRSVKAPTIGERRRPQPDGRPGFLRIDTVHQGDLHGLWGCETIKGVFYLNVVDEVTQWESVMAVPALTRRFVQPVLRLVLSQTFPFVILGLHADNGSEFVNHATAGLLQELQIEFTRSRARHSTDNGLVESKNAAVVRKQFGYGHIPVGFYEDINRFTAGVLAEHLNFHRPCWFPRETTDRKGRVIRQYRPQDLRTPYEKFRSLPDAASFLREGVTLEQLALQARRLSDNESAERLLRERKKLFKPILAHLASAA